LTGDTTRRFRFAPILTATVLTVLALWLFKTVANVFVLVFVGVLISLYLRALAGVIERRTKLREPLPFLLALTLTITAIVVLVSILVPPVVQQTQQLYTVLPNYIAGWEASIDRLAASYPGLRDALGEGDHRLVKAIYDWATEGAGQLLPRALGFVRVGIDVFAVTVIAIYLSLQPQVYRDWIITLFPSGHRGLANKVMTDLGTTLRRWIVGQLLTMFVLGLLTAVGLYALQVPFWLPFGLFAGLVAIVPFFGTVVSTILPALFVLNGTGIGSLGATGHSVLVIIFGSIVHVIGAYVVMPIIMQNEVNLPPVHVLVSVLVMGQLIGAMGLVIAVPSLAVLMVILKHVPITGAAEGSAQAA
jgi:predicted PurR-regulated permease PerM